MLPLAYMPTPEQIGTWATAIATIIILVRQQTTVKNSEEAKANAIDARAHAADAATVGVQTFHLVNGQMSAQLKRNAQLANKVAALVPHDEEAQQVAKDATDAVIRKDAEDQALLSSTSNDPTAALHRLAAKDAPKK